MFKTKFLIGLFCCVISNGMAQRSEFLKLARKELNVEEELLPIEKNSVGQQTFDPLGFDESTFESSVLYFLKLSSKNKRFPLTESFHLRSIAEITTKTIRNSYFEKRKKNFKKIVQKAQHATLSKFGLIEVRSFEIPLIQARNGTFYHDKKGPEGALNLYYNPEKKTKKQIAEEEKPEPKPVLLHTEAQIFEAVREKLKQHQIYSNLQSGNYYAAGIQVEVDKRTLFRKKIPMLRVVVVLGSKRMHLVQKKVEAIERRKKKNPSK